MPKDAILVLNLGLGPVFHPAAWRHPATDLAGVRDFAEYRRIALKAEAVHLHALFSADILALDPAQVSNNPVRQWEPFTFYAALAAITQRIGLIASVSTTFSHPFTLARQFSSLDSLSGGRAGWNIVTSALDRAAQNYGLDQLPEHDARYERAAEFVELAARLWNSWDADAFTGDRDSGVLYRPGSVRDVDFRGRFYASRGPLLAPPSPQVWPVLSQAGDSDAGRDFAARVAELVYTKHNSLGAARAYYTDLKGRAAALGRDPGAIKVLSGKDIILANTKDEALALRDQLAALRDPAEILANVAHLSGYDLTGLAPDAPLPPVPAETRQGKAHLETARRAWAQAAAESPAPVVADFVRALAGQFSLSAMLVGTASDVADHFEEWREAGAADGFILDPVLFPGTADRLLDELVPELVRRGLFRSQHSGGTLRESLGLPPRALLARTLPGGV